MDKNKKNTPALDLSFAYGTTILKQLSEHDIRMLQAAEEAAEETGGSDDPTIRTVTSLFTGKRGIRGLGQSIAERDLSHESEESDEEP